jgi:GT2 family glycosyltransferase
LWDCAATAAEAAPENALYHALREASSPMAGKAGNGGDDFGPACGPAVGVVIVNHNGGDRVLRVLAGLFRQRHPLGQVLVVDNASTDGTRARIREAYPSVLIIHLGSNQGIAIARNVGLSALTAPLALLIDHDVYVEDDCIEKLVRAYEEHGASVVCPRIRLLPERTVVQADGAALHFLGTQILRNGYQRTELGPAAGIQVDACIGACMLVDRRRVLEAGGFDEFFFFYFEDLEFSMRLRERGHTIWCEPSALVFHERGGGTPDLSFREAGHYPRARAYFTMRNRLISMLIHYRSRTLLILSPVLLLHEVACLVMAVRRGWPAEWLHAWGWVLRHRHEIGIRRRRMQQLRSVNDRELLVGGVPPLAPSFLRTAGERRVLGWYSTVVNRYWNFARGRIG